MSFFRNSSPFSKRNETLQGGRYGATPYLSGAIRGLITALGDPVFPNTTHPGGSYCLLILWTIKQVKLGFKNPTPIPQPKQVKIGTHKQMKQ